MSNSNCTFFFKFETQEKFSRLIQNLNCNEATQQYDIPIKILKENSEIFSYIYNLHTIYIHNNIHTQLQ